jgi:hypothetical protein
MANHPLNKAVTDVVTCIEYALKAEMFIPAVILIYSAIDAAAWLSCDNDHHTRKDFISWVDAWMMPLGKLQCTATELYSARCGILHTFTSKTSLTKQGAARQICYVNRASTVAEMDGYLRRVNKTGYVSIHLNDLYDSYKLGYKHFELNSLNDAIKSVRFKRKRELYYRQVDGAEADKMAQGK